MSKLKIASVRQEFRTKGDHDYYSLLLYFKLSATKKFLQTPPPHHLHCCNCH